MIYTCCDKNRRAAVDAHATLNGIDQLEVLDLDAPPGISRQRTLMVRLLKPVPAGLAPDNVRIEGGERVRNVAVEWVAPATAAPEAPAFFAALDEADQVLLVRTDSTGDFTTYTLRLVRASDDARPPADFDPVLAAVSFSFKVECPSDFDCRPQRVCPEEPAPAPDIDYLAKDYGGFRRLMLDRLSQLVPGWRERTAADLGVTLVELLSYAADHLSYWQDAVATEAYLETARRRPSLRRLARLVDYAVHEGCNARAWVQLRVSDDAVDLHPQTVRLYTRVPGAPDRIAVDSADDAAALRHRPEVFQPMHEVTLHESHNDLFFYTWGDKQCCLPAGGTRATLRGHYPDLRAGDVVVFVEVRGPLTGNPSDADPAHRHPVRLSGIQAFDGAAQLTDPLTEETITEIEWTTDDALPFPVCVSARTDDEHGAQLVEDISIALGNIVLCDHGRSITQESLGVVPPARLRYPADDPDHCSPGTPAPIPPRFRPPLAEAPLTRRGMMPRSTVEHGVRVTRQVPFDPDASARRAFEWRMADVVPDITLESQTGAFTAHWVSRSDLLSSSASDHHFVVETEHDGTVALRFGDDMHGIRPDDGTTFTADYRVGNGVAGNVGAHTIVHVVTDDGRISAAVNPMPARGGIEPETAAQIRRSAPQAFRTQQRAVTPADYAEVTERHDGVQRAAANLRWTGSWHTVFITVDRVGGEPLDTALVEPLARHVNRYRMAGHDLRFDAPVYVSLELDLFVCVAPHYFRGDVRAGLLEALGSGVLPDGRRGVFHPDNFTFGQAVYLSPVYAAAHQVAGVDSVHVTHFNRQGRDDTAPLNDGFLRLDRLEIARLDNDPSFPEHGVLRLELSGGK
ncbi:putative baseplate assembly protein [Rhodococcus sp. T2V]|uniref:putative baseplate assembly protein n=1 Tax=Rhodococcus sp. T2V TaxID=3034164 RepID=UPI0023E1C181|nr:putative baseplate assembly protein [Rhodococcus sp. T2V]MDF3308899.1 putative baseplate assembly protein [Rhodococcus sp. T2V]